MLQAPGFRVGGTGIFATIPSAQVSSSERNACTHSQSSVSVVRSRETKGIRAGCWCSSPVVFPVQFSFLMLRCERVGRSGPAPGSGAVERCRSAIAIGDKFLSRSPFSDCKLVLFASPQWLSSTNPSSPVSSGHLTICLAVDFVTQRSLFARFSRIKPPSITMKITAQSAGLCSASFNADGHLHSVVL